MDLLPTRIIDRGCGSICRLSLSSVKLLKLSFRQLRFHLHDGVGFQFDQFLMTVMDLLPDFCELSRMSGKGRIRIGGSVSSRLGQQILPHLTIWLSNP